MREGVVDAGKKLWPDTVVTAQVIDLQEVCFHYSFVPPIHISWIQGSGSSGYWYTFQNDEAATLGPQPIQRGAAGFGHHRAIQGGSKSRMLLSKTLLNVNAELHIRRRHTHARR